MPSFAILERAPWPLGSFAALAAAEGLAHGVTTRAGPAFGRDGRSARTATAAGAAAAALGLPAVAWVHQVHGGTVLRVRGPGCAGEADGLVTDEPGLALLGRSADCPLVLVAGRRRDGSLAVGFSHASWRATVRGVTAAVIGRLRDELGVDPATVVAGIAPSAGPCCYEVGAEVREEAVDRLGEGAARFFARVGDRWHFDLWSANLAQLTAAGVPAGAVVGSGLCTICQGERFWSWRVQGESAGRFAALVGVLAPGAS
jgi:YfiH family protein